MVKRAETQVHVTVWIGNWAISIPVVKWVPLSDTVRFTGRCRQVSTHAQPETEVEIISRTWLGLKKVSRFEWLEPWEIRTIEYFPCVEPCE